MVIKYLLTFVYMRNYLIYFLFCVNICMAQTSKVQESLPMSSKLLGRVVRYSVYLPGGYETSQRRYPVVYLLHGADGGETDWVEAGNMQQTVDAGIEQGNLPPMIVVMPDADNSYYMNNVKGSVPYEDFFVQELIPLIDSTYRTRAKRDYRALTGLSMGGYGSLMLSLHHPELFVSCAALSAAVFTDEQIVGMSEEFYNPRFADLLGAGKGQSRLTPQWKKYSILEMVKTYPEENLKKVKIYLDCGDDDFLTRGNCMLHLSLTDRKIPHQYRVRDGAHTWTYWRTGLLDALKFLSESFRRS